MKNDNFGAHGRSQLFKCLGDELSMSLLDSQHILYRLHYELVLQINEKSLLYWSQRLFFRHITDSLTKYI